jgi:esterase FrsA
VAFHPELHDHRNDPRLRRPAHHVRLGGRVQPARGSAVRRRPARRAGWRRGWARSAFLAASFWYFLARWPSPGPDRADAWHAYTRHRVAYLAAARHFRHHVEVLTAPIPGGRLVGYLHRPAGPPGSGALALVCGGIDVWKSDPAIDAITTSLLARGISVVTIDIPGTGESPVRAAAGRDHAFRALLDQLLTRRDIDAERLGAVGLSFGGHWATRLGLTDPRIRAVVNIAGPLHHAFQRDWLARLPPATLASLANSLGLDTRHSEQVISTLQGMSLVAQGLLHQPHRPAFLVVNGARDEQVPIADLHLLTEHGIAQDSLIFGTDRHCASYATPLHRPFIADWLAAHLGN